MLIATAPLSFTSHHEESSPSAPASGSEARPDPPQAVRRRLPDERHSITHKFKVGSHEGYLTVGLYPGGQPGELFITMAKEGSTVSGLISSFAQAISIALQHGVPIKLFCDKYAHTRFEPSGWTGNPDIPQASSVMDYIFRWLQQRFVAGHNPAVQPPRPTGSDAGVSARRAEASTDSGEGPSCVHCGAITQRAGSCYYCRNCGGSSGCG